MIWENKGCNARAFLGDQKEYFYTNLLVLQICELFADWEVDLVVSDLGSIVRSLKEEKKKIVIKNERMKLFFITRLYY